MSHTIKNLGILLLISAWLVSCGNKPNDSMNNPGTKDLKDLETKEKSLLDELKPFVEDGQADYVAKFYIANNRIFSDTPLYELQPKLKNLIVNISKLEEAIKASNPYKNNYVTDQPFLKGKEKDQDLEGLKKWLELKKATKEKYERALGISSSTK
jgi:hypothetical protein